MICPRGLPMITQPHIGLYKMLVGPFPTPIFVEDTLSQRNGFLYTISLQVEFTEMV
jgi:hypothetical protein